MPGRRIDRPGSSPRGELLESIDRSGDEGDAGGTACVIYLRVTVHEQVPEPGGILQPGGQRLLQQSSFAERGERVGECPRRLQPF